jgi:hypothetical protein
MMTPLTNRALAALLNRRAHEGGRLTEYGVWYSLDAHPDCLTFILGYRHWDAALVQAAKDSYHHES